MSESSNIETIWIELKPKHAPHLLVCTIYRPEPDKLPTWSEQFEQELDNAFIENKKIILMVDLNIDLLKPDEVPEHWSDIVEAFSLTQLINETTRFTEKSQTLLDHMYVTASVNIRKHHVPKSGMSDHYPVCLVHKVSGQRNGHHTTIKYRSFKNFDPIKFNDDLDKVAWSILDTFDDLMM